MEAFKLPIGKHYEPVDDVYLKTNFWGRRRPWNEEEDEKPQPELLFKQDGTLLVYLTAAGWTQGDGWSVTPDYDYLATLLRKSPRALLNVWIGTDWNIECGAQPSILTRHLELLYDNIHRWQALRVDAHLFNYLLCQKEWQTRAQRNPPFNLKILTIDELGEASKGDITPLIQFVNQVLRSSPNQQFPHLEISTVHNRKRKGPMFSLKQIRQFPFNHLRKLAITATIPSAQVYEILKVSGEAIEELYAADLTGPSPSLDAMPVPMRNLRVLSLFVGASSFEAHQKGWAFGLLRKISTTRLRELALGYENEWDSRAFAEFCDLTPTRRLSIGVLRLERMSLNGRQFKMCMDRTDGCLSELVVECQMDHWRGYKTPLVFNQEICGIMISGAYMPYVSKLVVGEQCIEKSGCFGDMLRNLVVHGSLGKLIILGKNAASTMHPRDMESCHYVHEVEFPDCASLSNTYRDTELGNCYYDELNFPDSDIDMGGY